MKEKIESTFSGIEEEGAQSKKPKKNKGEKSSRTPILDNFSRDLIKLASEGKLDPVVGRKAEITRVAQILCRRKKNNPVLIGGPGCGKTALAEGLALKIHSGKCPRNLLDKKIVALELTSLVAGTKYRGQFEERMKAVLEELRENPDIIIFIDELHTVVGTGNSSGSLDAANIFKPALARGELQCIGATTLDEYRENIEKDGALERRFQKVMVEPTTIEETLEILINLKEKYEDHHKVVISNEILKLCVKLAERYITHREFPDKAIDIMDEVGAKVQVDIEYPVEIESLRKNINKLGDEKKSVVKSQQYEKAAQLRDKELKLLKRLDSLKFAWELEMEEKRTVVDLDDLYTVVSQMTKIPLSKLSENEMANLIDLESKLREHVVGQDEAIEKICKAIRRNRVGIRDGSKPIGTFMFLGQTGIGKTHLAKSLAKEIFGSTDSLIRVDMSEYQEKFNTSRLIGSPPGYVGYNQGGQLTEAVRNKPYSVVLFDEIEKAHPDVFNILLQVFDDGHMTDGMGRVINFKNTLIIMTSNIGVKKLQDFGNGIGFNTSARLEKKEEALKDIIASQLKKSFSPEFLNRVDDTIVFNYLDEKNIEEIVKIELNNLKERLLEKNYNITFNVSVKKFIAKESYDEKFGARPLKRMIQNKIEDFISEEILKGKIKENCKYSISMDKKTEKLKLKSL
jgi:ATP-dependent Clp protease ATP-binding subunit ClpC